MPKLGEVLELDRCPHCNVDRPNLTKLHQSETTSYSGQNRRFWRVYKCGRCGGLVTAFTTTGFNGDVSSAFPANQAVDTAIPSRAREYLGQALNSLHAPVGAVMLAASAVDSMLKSKGLKDGSLYNRIDKAVADHIITRDMAEWAHDVRLDANDQRHADENTGLPDPSDAGRAIDFATALGQFMFVLPARVQRGIAEAAKKA